MRKKNNVSKEINYLTVKKWGDFCLENNSKSELINTFMSA